MDFITVFMTMLTFLVLLKQFVGKKRFILLMDGVMYHPYTKKTFLAMNMLIVLLSLFLGMLTFVEMFIFKNYDPYVAFAGSSLMPIASIMLFYNSNELMKENKPKKRTKKKSKKK